jgi:hypothetical protein
LPGVVADLLGLTAAFWVVAAITAVSGLVVAFRMYETHPRARGAGVVPHGSAASPDVHGTIRTG